MISDIILGMIVLVFIYMVFVFTPVNIYAESQCLAKGYPEYRVSVGLEIYCLNLDGSVTVNVDKL